MSVRTLLCLWTFRLPRSLPHAPVTSGLSPLITSPGRQSLSPKTISVGRLSFDTPIYRTGVGGDLVKDIWRRLTWLVFRLTFPRFGPRHQMPQSEGPGSRPTLFTPHLDLLGYPQTYSPYLIRYFLSFYDNEDWEKLPQWSHLTADTHLIFSDFHPLFLHLHHRCQKREAK